MRTKSRSKPPDPSLKGPAHESFVYAADGTRLYVRERSPVDDGRAKNHSGAAEGTGVRTQLTTILCDGICCDGYIWKYLWDDLSEVTRLCHWNYRGHGRSALPSDVGRIDIPTHADDLNQVRRHVGDGPVVLVGHSMGCPVALEAYHQRPDQVRGLVLLCGSSGHLTHSFHGNDWLARVLPKLIRFAESRPGLSRGLWSRIPVKAALNLAFVAGEVDKASLARDDLLPYFEHAADMDFLLFLRMLEATGGYSAEPFLATVDVPVLVLAGEADKFTPRRFAEEMAKALPRAELVMLPGATHVAPLEQRDIVAQRIAQFLEATSAGPLP
ncbi:MAG TPA: alpha/beta hydrolase [Polyangiaceae bacterium]|nr:alpha/beta hydrolase [Polyangiaceae bacterium]